MEKFKRIAKILIFNIAETFLIFLLGLLLDLQVKYVVLIMLTFLFSRGCFGRAIHFKTWYRCLIWSLLILLSLFVLFKVDIIVSIMFAIFSAFIMTGRADIKNLYLWKNNKDEPSKYQDIMEFIKYNEFDDGLLEFEKKLKEKSSVEYLVYKYRFKEHKTFSEISELLDLDNPRIVEKLDTVAFALRLYCKI